MREDHEELILRNPAFGACAFWQFARSFADAAEGRAPQLAHFVIGAGMLFHAATVEKVSGMRFESGLLKAITDKPELIAGLQVRIEAALPDGLSALQLGVAARILERQGGLGMPSFRALGVDLPKPLRSADPRVSTTYSAAKRLGTWFAAEDLGTVRSRLVVRF